MSEQSITKRSTNPRVALLILVAVVTGIVGILIGLLIGGGLNQVGNSNVDSSTSTSSSTSTAYSAMDYRDQIIELVSGTRSWTVTDHTLNELDADYEFVLGCTDGQVFTKPNYVSMTFAGTNIQQTDAYYAEMKTILATNGWTKCVAEDGASGVGSSRIFITYRKGEHLLYIENYYRDTANIKNALQVLFEY